jgi:hypothetical protein
MTTKELQYQIDITKDYYGILGVSSSVSGLHLYNRKLLTNIFQATVEEIKAAHVKLGFLIL